MRQHRPRRPDRDAPRDAVLPLSRSTTVAASRTAEVATTAEFRSESFAVVPVGAH
jgi:hypothetical protein